MHVCSTYAYLQVHVHTHESTSSDLSFQSVYCPMFFEIKLKNTVSGFSIASGLNKSVLFFFFLTDFTVPVSRAYSGIQKEQRCI